MFESDQHVPDCRVRKNRKAVVEGTQTLSECKRSKHWQSAEFVPVHLTSYLFGTKDKFCLCFDPFLNHFIGALSLCLILSYTEALTIFSIPRHPLVCQFSLTLFSFSFSLWRLKLALVVTVFISSILEGLRRDEIHSFVGGVKKRRALYSTALYLWYREILNETWGRSEHQCLISVWPSSGPRKHWIRHLFLISTFETLVFSSVYSNIIKKQLIKAFFLKQI